MIRTKHSPKVRMPLLIALSLWLSVLTPVHALTLLSGDLEAFLKGIDYGDSGDNTWVEPDAWRLARFSIVFDQFLHGDFAAAHQLAAEIGYEVLEYTDTASNPPRVHYILWETQRLPAPEFTGGGTYVLYPGGDNLVLEAPHPVYDRFTSEQAIETHLKVGSRLLALAGTRRDNSTLPSPCTGTYVKSDASHYTQHFFSRAHERASMLDSATLFIQFHGFGNSSLKKLQAQCGSDNPLLVNLSTGVRDGSSGTDFDFMQLLSSKIEAGGLITPCSYGRDTRSLGGTWNVQGRYTNGSIDACLYNAAESSERFIHLEQSFRVRSRHRESMADYIAQALSDYTQ